MRTLRFRHYTSLWASFSCPYLLERRMALAPVLKRVDVENERIIIKRQVRMRDFWYVYFIVEHWLPKLSFLIYVMGE